MFFRRYILGLLVWLIYRFLYATWRIQYFESAEFKKAIERREPLVLAFWHGDEIPLMSTSKRYKVAVLVSKSKDGEMMNTVIRLLGAKTARGSSSRSAVSGLKALVKWVRQGYTASFAVDGPKGPIHVVKPGVFEVAHLIRGKIASGSSSADRAWHFPKAWNKAFLPKPFARVHIHWRDPVDYFQNGKNPKDQSLAIQLHDELMKARKRAKETLDHPDSRC